MISNCYGCQEEYSYMMSYLQEGYDLYFAGSGLYEKGHLIMILVNDKGKIIVG